MRRIILDTDPGVDDALAFLLAFNSPEINVEAITTVAGNVNQSKAHRNSKQLLEFLGRTDVPICEGAIKPLKRKIHHAEEFHGTTGLGNARLPNPSMVSDKKNAVQMIIDKSNQFEKDLSLVAVGPLTNIASAIEKDPNLPNKIDSLVIMGGAFYLTPYGFGNANRVAEFNIWHDPEAARIVFKSNINLICVGLDVTTHPKYRLSKDQFTEIKSLRTKKSKLIVDLCGNIVERFDGFSLHDPMALAYTINPDIFTSESHHVDIELVGELTSGMTVVERREYRKRDEPNANIIVKVEPRKFHKLFMERVTGV